MGTGLDGVGPGREGGWAGREGVWEGREEGLDREDTAGLAREDTEGLARVDTEGLARVDAAGLDREDTAGLARVGLDRVGVGRGGRRSPFFFVVFHLFSFFFLGTRSLWAMMGGNPSGSCSRGSMGGGGSGHFEL